MYYGTTGSPIGIWKDYYDNGQLKSIGEHNGDGGFDVSKTGEWKEYYDNGQLLSVGNYTDETGKKIGLWKGYFENGDVEYQTNYNDQGETNGRSIFKNENGTIFQEADYVNGKVYNVSTYNDKQGNPLKIGSLSNGNGTLNEYIDGTLINELQIVDGHFESDSFFIEKSWNSYSDLNSYAWNVYENPDSSASQLKYAIQWVKRSIELDKNNANTDTLAALFYRTGDYSKALSMAIESINLAKETHQDTTPTEQLIEKIRMKL
jgi:antitoxin component YwqK of YwqJK toxin-antitoxin module